MNKYAIIVAGGSGVRLGGKLPKQFIMLHNKPVLQYSIDAFWDYDPKVKIILVVHPDFIEYWKNLKKQYCSRPYIITAGGDTRFQSVKHGLQHIKEEGLVAVHDAARPLLLPEHIGMLYATAAEKGSAIPATRINDTIRQLTPNGYMQINRDELRAIQTPQIFKSGDLKKAYQQPYCESFTDDASVMESKGFGITLVAGSERNIKITREEDFIIASALLSI